MILVTLLLLAFVLLATALYIPIVATIRPVGGPDAMGLAGVFFLGLARALALGVALTLAVVRGGFAWIHESRGAQWLVVMAALAATAALEVWSLAAATGSYGRPARIWVAVFAVAAPLGLAFLAAVGVDAGRRMPVGVGTVRGVAVVFVVLVAAGAVDLGRESRALAKRRQAHVAIVAAESKAELDANRARLRVLGPESPLRDWLEWTRNPVEELRQTALDSVRARPRLHEELADLLRSDDPLPALRWLWLWSPDRPASLAPALLDAAAGLPQWAAGRLDDSDPQNDSDVDTACEALVVLVDQFESSGVDYRPAMEAISEFLDARALPEDQISYDPTYRARSLLAYWFGARAAKT